MPSQRAGKLLDVDGAVVGVVDPEDLSEKLRGSALRGLGTTGVKALRKSV